VCAVVRKQMQQDCAVCAKGCRVWRGPCLCL